MLRFILVTLGLLCNLQALERPVPMEDKLPIELQSVLIGTVYKQNGKILDPKSINLVLSDYQECREDISSSKAFQSPALILSALGGALIGFPLGLAITGEDFNYPLFYAGLGTATVGLVLAKISDNKLGKAIKRYNSILGKTSLQFNLMPIHQSLAIQKAF